MIEDARDMYRIRFGGPAMMRQFEDRILEKRGKARREKRGQVRAYVNHGRWVADCECNAGIAVWLDAWYATCCLECGNEYEVVFPDVEFMAELDRLLSLRVDVSTRNWTDESLESIAAENRLMGGIVEVPALATDGGFHTSAAPVWSVVV